jgi:membrane associated rhomboid family serine protease
MPSRRSDLLERLPVVSLAIAAVWLLACFTVQLGFASEAAESRLLVRQAIEHVIRHPSLEVNPRLIPAVRHALPSFEGNEMFSFLRGKRVSVEQSELDALVAQAFDRLDAHPSRALGLVPAQGPTLAFATHPFVHGGVFHALLSCLLLLAAGPLLEAVWGRRLFGAACVLASLAGALLFRLVHADLDRALVGGGALVSGLVAGVVVRFWNEEVDVAGWLAPFASFELRVPSWALAPVWGVYQGALLWAGQGPLPGGLQNAHGIVASLGGAAAGTGLALAYARWGLEQRLGGQPVVRTARKADGRFDIERVKRARARGDLETAFELLRLETRRSARNRDVVLLFWEVAVESDKAEAAAPAMLQLVREELRRNALDAAVSHWRRLGERAPGALLDPATLLKLLPLIRSKLGDDAAVLALHQAADPANRGFTPELGAEIARTAAPIEPDVALKAASRALKATGLPPELAAELRALVERLQPKGEDEEDLGELPSVPKVEFEDEDDHDRSAFGAVDDLSADPPAAPATPAAAAPAASPPPPPEPAPPAAGAAESATEPPPAQAPHALFPGVRVAAAVPVSLGEEDLTIYVSGKGSSRLAYGRITAVSLAAVRGLAGKPVVLVDLLLSGPQPGPEPLLLVRLRSDQFDPRKLVPSAAGPLEALHGLVEELLKRSRAQSLPDPESGRGRPLRMFDSLEAYSSQVLRVAPA